MATTKTKKPQSTEAELAEKQALGKRLSEQLIVGQRVQVVKENGEEVETIVAGYPWQTGYDEWVVALEGFGVAYDITRVRPIGERPSRSIR